MLGQSLPGMHQGKPLFGAWSHAAALQSADRRRVDRSLGFSTRSTSGAGSAATMAISIMANRCPEAKMRVWHCVKPPFA